MKNKTGESVIRSAIKQGEPTFTIRAKDLLALETLHTYLKSAISLKCSPEFITEIGTLWQEFYDWKLANPDKMKIPD